MWVTKVELKFSSKLLERVHVSDVLHIHVCRRPITDKNLRALGACRSTSCLHINDHCRLVLMLRRWRLMTLRQLCAQQLLAAATYVSSMQYVYTASPTKKSVSPLFCILYPWSLLPDLTSLWRDIFRFCALTLLVVRQEWHPACRKPVLVCVGGDDLTGTLHVL